VPPGGSKVVVVKLNVTGTADFATIRSCKLMANDSDAI
jgi:hypothetical protein